MTHWFHFATPAAVDLTPACGDPTPCDRGVYGVATGCTSLVSCPACRFALVTRGGR